MDVKVVSKDNRDVRRTLEKRYIRVITNEVFFENQFLILTTAYDGIRTSFSAVQLPTREFRPKILKGGEVENGLCTFTTKFV